MDHLPAMVAYTQNIIHRVGWKRFINGIGNVGGGPCGCMGPRNGEPYCMCRMSNVMHQNAAVIVNEINPEMAKVIMRKRLVEALGGKLEI